MKRRYLIVAVGIAVIVLLALGTFAMLPPRPGVTKANIDRIRVGMTEADVETILGKQGKWIFGETEDESFEYQKLYWGEYGSAWIAYRGSRHTVTSAHWSGEDDGLIDVFQRFFRWPWW